MFAHAQVECVVSRGSLLNTELYIHDCSDSSTQLGLQCSCTRVFRPDVTSAIDWVWLKVNYVSIYPSSVFHCQQEKNLWNFRRKICSTRPPETRMLFTRKCGPIGDLGRNVLERITLNFVTLQTKLYLRFHSLGATVIFVLHVICFQ